MTKNNIPSMGAGAYTDTINSRTQDVDYELTHTHWRLPTKAEHADLLSTQGLNVPVTQPMTQALPICPYGCGEPGQLKEIVMVDTQAIGIFADSDGCVFRANIEIGEPPTKRKLVIGPDGQLKEG